MWARREGQYLSRPRFMNLMANKPLVGSCILGSPVSAASRLRRCSSSVGAAGCMSLMLVSKKAVMLVQITNQDLPHRYMVH